MFKKTLFIFLLLVMYVQILPAISINNPDEMLKYVKAFLPESPVILEAGGNSGEDTCRMKAVWPSATMHVFEPLPSSFSKIVQRTRDLKNVNKYQYALTTYSGKINFYVDVPNNAASSIGCPVEWNQVEFDKTPVEVPCTTINDWAEANKISNIDFMWLDMEGHELYALKHASKILKTVKAIYTEVDFVPIRVYSCLYIDLKLFLESQGFFEVCVLVDRPRVQGDALFVKKNLLK